MKDKVLKIISCIMAVTITILLLTAAVNVTERKESISKYQAFFEEEEDFDVLFFGSSVVINCISPMQLWDEHGIVSYNLGGHANYISTSYWVMRNALDYTTPKVAVIDCRNMRVDSRAHSNYPYLHFSLDAFPLTATKIEAVNDLLRDEEHENAALLRSEMLFPFVSYHSRWSSLAEYDFSPVYNVEKGAELRVGVATPMEHDLTPTDQTLTEPSISIEYLERFITDCQERDIEVLLLYVPVTSPEPYKIESQTIPLIAEKYGVQSLNLLHMGVVDFETDCYDSEPHLNPSGAYKVTAVLGDYLAQHYDLANHKEDPAFAHWHEDYETYLKYRQSLFADTQKNKTAIMSLMLDDDYDYMLQISPAALTSKSFGQMLTNLGVDADKIPADGGYVLIQKGSREIEYFSLTAFNEQPQNTVLGSLAVNESEDAVSVVLDGQTILHRTVDQWNAGNYLRMYMILNAEEVVCREFAAS